MRKRNLLLVVGACLTTLSLAVGSAMADPVNPAGPRALAGTGSDTTQGVMNGLSDIVKDSSGTKIIASYDAATAPGQTITTKNTTACTNIPRPSGSGAGIDALNASVQANNGCLQFARSSKNDSQSRTGQNLTYIPFAVDAVSYALRSDSGVSRSLSLAQLTTIYNCGGGPNIKPLLPQFGSGTRQFFLSKLGFTDASDFTSQTNHTCISQVDANGNPLLENTGNLLTDPKQIAPYSTAQYLAQVNGVVPDVHGVTLLGAINSINAAVLNNSSVGSRDVYNVVPNSQLGVAPTSTTFVGSSSAVCSPAATATIQRFGFGVNPACGDTSIHTP